MMKSFLLPLLCVAATSALGIPSKDLLVGESELDKRNPVAIIMGMTMIGASGNSAAQVVNMNFDDSLPFNEGSGNCRMFISTQGGVNCDVETTPDSRAGVGTDTTKHDGDWNVCWWDDEKKISGRQYFTDPGIGKYSIVFTARDSDNVNEDIEGAEGCEGEGMCHPQVTFYRDGYDLVLNTWESVYQGSVSPDGVGLCQGGVLDQFHKGGMVLGYTCAVPCEGDKGIPSDKS
ncbi:hypothetical protein P168DRAFT_314912 [Aspergillus campestris IBT 28561]|uniref:Secreted protein n=1 Tax=Aspergillus campestris (strain IBT 28561) TaxID=1392248 RepID=A0A2I1DG65_ASPC2|nr:uncharacterized protein P168DRAFT_314912 [Aspergillus campestris IBT 28561]PKY08864.1 hypothetical protein P168DRAFT_314912 [Aspergillus campestris IBT 28561]